MINFRGQLAHLFTGPKRQGGLRKAASNKNNNEESIDAIGPGKKRSTTAATPLLAPQKMTTKIPNKK